MAHFEIHPIDLCFPYWSESIASFLVIGPQGPTLVETGPASTLPRLVEELARRGIAPSDVRDVLVTHIHLDHAGAAGWWAQQGARVHVHHVGAPHLIDPSKVVASARRIYGEMTDRLWGEMPPAPADGVHALQDGERILAGGLTFLAKDTPGHARHHMVYRLGEVAFTGDLAGVRLPGQSHIRMPTPPPEFDLTEWQASIERMRAERFSRLYLTHFGPVEEVEAHWEMCAALLAEGAERVRRDLERGASREEMVAHFAEKEVAQQAAEAKDPDEGSRRVELGLVGMSVDGLVRYWSKQLGSALQGPSESR